MNFYVLTEEEFTSFAKDHEYESFMQTVELGNLKKESLNTPHYLGMIKGDKIVAATLLLEEKRAFGRKTFYAPRGFLIDYKDLELLKLFTEEIKKFIKKKKGFKLTIDPNVAYRKRSSDGDIINEEKFDIAINNLKEIGYKHFGFNKYFEALQVRWSYQLELNKPYEELKSNFSKSTRKNIESCYKKGLRVRVGTIDDLPTMENIFDVTAKRKDFSSRSLEYYQKMYKDMGNLMTIYIAYLDSDIYYDNTKLLLENEKKNNEEIIDKISKNLVGAKLTNQKEISDKLIKKYEEELKKAKKFKEDNPNGKDIACLLSIKSGKYYLTLSSGCIEEYKSFTPKYALYDTHIKDAYEMGYKMVDCYGITGDFNKDNKFYGIYEFKKGFNGNVIELIGEFTIEIGPIGKIYSISKKLKNIIKRTN